MASPAATLSRPCVRLAAAAGRVVSSAVSYSVRPSHRGSAPKLRSTRPFATRSPRLDTWAEDNGPGCLDLRSDVTTIPTQSMLAAIQSSTHGDDVYGEDPVTAGLERDVARLAGKEAGLFVLSGTMGNQLSLRSLLTQPPHAVLCDERSHVLNHEAGAISSLTGAQVQPVTATNGQHLTLKDVQSRALLGTDIHICPTRVISLENTLNGMIIPTSETRRITTFARDHGIRTHLDGTRLWEAAAAGAGSISELCAPFDTVNLCFTKGLGAPVGGMIVGTEDVIRHARWTRKAIGGGMRQPGLLAAACRVAVEEVFGREPDGRDGRLPASHDLAREMAALWGQKGGMLRYPVHTNICWLDLAAAGCSEDGFVALCAEAGLRSSGGRLVTHYQLALNRGDVLRRLEGVFTRVLGEKEGGLRHELGIGVM